MNLVSKYCSTLTPQIIGNHRVIPDHMAMSYYHPWSVFRADNPDHTGLKHILIQLVFLYIRDLLNFDCGI